MLPRRPSRRGVDTKALGAAFRKRRMNSLTSSVIMVIQAGSFDPVVPDLEGDTPLVDRDQRRFEMATR